MILLSIILSSLFRLLKKFIQIQKDTKEFANQANRSKVFRFDILALKIDWNSKFQQLRLYSTLILGAEYNLFQNKFETKLLSNFHFTKKKESKHNIINKLASK